MAASHHSDALVLFGVTGDLAHKMIFPALYAMAKRATLRTPVIGVAFPKWSLERLRKRVMDSIRRAGGVDNQRALDHLLSLLRYVSGDYNDQGTFTAMKEALGGARRPAHYLAIPPSLFETMIKGLGAANLAEHARVLSKSRSDATLRRRGSSTASRRQYSSLRLTTGFALTKRRSWGPKEADVIIASNGSWHNPDLKETSG